MLEVAMLSKFYEFIIETIANLQMKNVLFSYGNLQHKF